MISLEEAVCLVFALWFLVSVLYQFRFGPYRRLARWNWFHLIPSWSFFAPNPGRSDFHLLTRDLLADGVSTEWRRAPTLRRQRPIEFFWHPSKRIYKTLTDMVNRLVLSQYTEMPDPEQLQFNTAYLVILNYVEGLPWPDAKAQARQFIIVQSFTLTSQEPPRIVLRSRFHERPFPT